MRKIPNNNKTNNIDNFKINKYKKIVKKNMNNNNSKVNIPFDIFAKISIF